LVHCELKDRGKKEAAELPGEGDFSSKFVRPKEELEKEGKSTSKKARKLGSSAFMLWPAQQEPNGKEEGFFWGRTSQFRGGGREGRALELWGLESRHRGGKAVQRGQRPCSGSKGK